MPSPINNQNFVQARSGGTGNWIGKLFGGVGEAARARSMAQIQLDLHGERAKIDTEHIKERATHKTVTEAAAKDYLAESGYKRGGRAMKRGIKNAPALNEAKIVDFDSNGIPRMQRTGASGSNTSTDTDGMEVTNTPNNPDTPPSTPPKDRASNPARKPRARSGTIKEVEAAIKVGGIDKEQATMISPAYAAREGRKAASAATSSDAPQVTPSSVKKPRKPRTPKAGA